MKTENPLKPADRPAPELLDLDPKELEAVEGGLFTGTPIPNNGIRVGQWAINELNAAKKFFGL